eukprot:TRINITY_DN22110_c0_g1_i2.p2 TRINITY_DN22110_c0_g1~~TRINITY_DN22110_c0_g1_i2.p2  ORF type:complete len:123 (-),score=35.97 TRINITY_DN22110_c0_g1_i2:346-714(-)
MLRSLVGSEMCIRDSRTADPESVIHALTGMSFVSMSVYDEFVIRGENCVVTNVTFHAGLGCFTLSVDNIPRKVSFEIGVADPRGLRLASDGCHILEAGQIVVNQHSFAYQPSAPALGLHFKY